MAGNDRSGIFSVDGAVYCSDCYISRNANHAISVVCTWLPPSSPAVVALVHCDLAGNRDGIVSYAVCGPLLEPVGANSNSRQDHDDGDGDGEDDELDDGHRDAPVYSLNSIVGDCDSSASASAWRIQSSDGDGAVSASAHSGRSSAGSGSPFSAYANANTNTQSKNQQRELERYSWPKVLK